MSGVNFSFCVYTRWLGQTAEQEFFPKMDHVEGMLRRFDAALSKLICFWRVFLQAEN